MSGAGFPGRTAEPASFRICFSPSRPMLAGRSALDCLNTARPFGSVRYAAVACTVHRWVELGGADRSAPPDVHGATRHELGRASLSR